MKGLPQIGSGGSITPCPRWDLHKGDIASIGAIEDRTLRRITFERAIPGRSAGPNAPAQGRLLQFIEIPDGGPLFLSDADIAQLSKEGRFRIEMLDSSDGKARADLPTALSLTDAERARIDGRMKYVSACLALGDEFRFNHAKMRPVIQAVADAHGETPVSTSTVFRDIHSFRKMGDRLGSAALARKRGREKRGSQFSPAIDCELHRCMTRSLALPKGTAEDALALLTAWSHETYPDQTIELPSLRTVQRRYSEWFDQYTRDEIRHGPLYAERKHGAYYERRLPKLPLEEVEVDHTLFDIILIDEESGAIFGRPDVVTIRDRCTGVCLGFGVGWEVPSYTSFLEAVRHAMYPKDLSAWPSLQRQWPCFGRWKRLFVDNAMHFIGDNIAHAGQELKFEVVELRPGEPWMKGAEERLFGLLNRKIVHNLPGATMSNAQERKDFEERLEPPKLSLRRFEAFLVKYIVEDYHWRLHEGLGPLRTLPDVPMRLWERDIEKVKIRALPDPDTFAALAGDTARRTIQHTGIEWDHIVYQSEDLVAIRVNPQHKPGKTRHTGTRYRVTRDPQDLGRIWVFDPYRQQRFEVPAVRQDYAAGLPLHHHQVLVARHREMIKGAVDIDGLRRVRATMLRLAEKVMNDKTFKDVDRKLARFLGGQTSKRIRSRIHPENYSAAGSAELLDLEQPVGVVGPELRSERAPNATRRGASGKAGRVRPVHVDPDELPREGDRPLIQDDQPSLPAEHQRDGDDDAPSLDELRSRHSDWEDE
jgi:putative transposase